MKIKELRVISLDLIDEEIISKIINIQYDKDDDVDSYIIFYKEDKSE